MCIPPLNCRQKGRNYSMLDENGIICKGMEVNTDDILIGKVLKIISKNGNETEKDISITAKKSETGVVDRIIITKSETGYKLVRIIIRNHRIPEVGDKLSSRSAQKGTIGAVFRHEDLPFTSQGIVPDLIINPHAIPSRMTINQLMETALGKWGCFSGEECDASPFTKGSINAGDEICRKLSSVGFCGKGWEVMRNGMTGEMFKARIFIGPTYYQRLKHMVKDKIHSRSRGHVTMLTRQPLEGRSRNGGLRFGEMERDAMISHGTSRFLKERLFEMSDPYQVNICEKCGNIVFSTKQCYICKRDDPITVNFPYSAKLLSQELISMGLRMKFSTLNKK